MRALGPEEVDEPVPAVGRLDDHLRFRTGGAHLGDDAGEIGIVEPDHRMGGAGVIPPDDDRAAAVQIDADILFLHRGSPSSWLGWFGDLECVNTRPITTK